MRQLENKFKQLRFLVENLLVGFWNYEISFLNVIYVFMHKIPDFVTNTAGYILVKFKVKYNLFIFFNFLKFRYGYP